MNATQHVENGAATGKRRKREAREANPEAATTGEPKAKRPRKPRAAKGEGYLAELRSGAAKHRASIAKLVESERDLEAKLAAVRAQREAAEGPLAEVEAILARFPELTLDAPANDVPAEPNAEVQP